MDKQESGLVIVPVALLELAVDAIRLLAEQCDTAGLPGKATAERVTRQIEAAIEGSMGA